MKLTKKEFNKLRPLNNRVLLKVIDKTSIKNVGGVDIIIDASYKKVEHFDYEAEVVKTPTLYYDESGKSPHLLPYKTPLEIQVGDKVLVNYFELMGELGELEYSEKEPFEYDGNKYVLLDYRYIYVLERGGAIKPINGYAIIETFDFNMVSKNIIIPDSLKKIPNTYFAIMKYSNTVPNRIYFEDDKANDTFTADTTKIGDIVMIKKNKGVKILPHNEKFFDKDKEYKVVQYRDIMLILNVDLQIAKENLQAKKQKKKLKVLER